MVIMLNVFTYLKSLFAIFLFLLFISGCQQSSSDVTIHKKISAERPIGKSLPDDAMNQTIHPITIEEAMFHSVIDFVDEKRIVYIENNSDGTSSINLYNFIEGVSEWSYRANAPIIHAEMSPSKKYLLVHSSPMMSEAKIDIIDLKMKSVIVSDSIPSFELAYEWNPYNDQQLLITAFQDDFTYKMFDLNIKSGEKREVSLSQPFVKWKSDSEVIAINWNINEPQTSAPLIQFQMNGDGKTIDPNHEYYFIDSWEGILMLFSINQNNQHTSTVTFFNSEMEKIYEKTIPHLNAYSTIVVPYLDYIEEKKSFYMILPKEYGETDMYTGGFQLVEIHPFDGKEKVLIEDIMNAPLSCHNKGDQCLIGYRYENMLSLYDQSLQPIVNVKE